MLQIYNVYTCLNSNWCQPCFTDALLDDDFEESELFGKTGPSPALIFENVPQGVVDFLITVETFSDGTVDYSYDWVLYGLPDPGNLTFLEASTTSGINGPTKQSYYMYWPPCSSGPGY